MLVSLLLCERMENNECIFLIGCERFSKYKGYADSFEFAGDFRDETIKSVPHALDDRRCFFVLDLETIGVEDGVMLSPWMQFASISHPHNTRWKISIGSWLRRIPVSSQLMEQDPMIGSVSRQEIGVVVHSMVKNNWKVEKTGAESFVQYFICSICGFSADSAVSCISSESSIGICRVWWSTFGGIIC